MFLRLQAYHRPQSVAEALELRRQPNTCFIAGGTSLTGIVDDTTEGLVDLSSLDLRYIREAGGQVALGATTTLADLVSSPTVRTVGGGIVGVVAGHTGSLAFQARATVGGIVAAGDGAEELLAVLLALDSSVVVVRPKKDELGPVRETWDLSTFIRRRQEILQSALIQEIQVPAAPVMAAMERVARTPRDLPVVAVVAVSRLQGGGVANVRLAAAGLAAVPERLEMAESICGGTDLRDDVIGRAAAVSQNSICPPDDFRGQSDFRRHLAGVLVRRALMQVRPVGAGTVKE